MHPIKSSVDFSPNDLVSSRYISSEHGSTALDLSELLRDHGVAATVIQGLDPATIRSCLFPLILHLGSSHEHENTNHWVCYLGEKHGKAVIYDPPHEPTLIEYGDLLSGASGYAVAVSLDELDFKYLGWYAKVHIAVLLITTLVALAILNNFSYLLKSPWSQFLPIFSVALLLTAACQFDSGGSLLTDSFTVRQLQEEYSRAESVEPISLLELQQLLDSGVVNVVDARIPESYSHSHIEGAINWPVDASMVEQRIAWNKIDSSKITVVYCETSKCVWDEVVATKLKARGLGRVFVLQEGFVEWSRNAEADQ